MGEWGAVCIVPVVAENRIGMVVSVNPATVASIGFDACERGTTLMAGATALNMRSCGRVSRPVPSPAKVAVITPASDFQALFAESN